MAPGSSATRRSLEQGELADTLILTKVNDYKRARYVLASIGHFGPVINNHFISAPLLTCFYHLRSGTEFLNLYGTRVSNELFKRYDLFKPSNQWSNQ
jgi:hypothetical protein